ncbi:MAG: hypothetical protein IKP71_05150 [Candidatus Riflebacteria bacterium]|nr:hypothetical protein [Candidatus Riflebacteria bacterium]
MLKKVLSITAAIVLLISLLPYTYGGDPGSVYIGVKDSERYYHRLKNMRRNDPENAEISYKIANFYYSKDMLDKAIEEYKRTLKLDANHQYAKWFLSQCLASKGYFEDAFWLVRELIDKNRKDYELYDEAGELLVKMGEYAASREYFNKVDELKYGEVDGSKAIPSFSKPNRGSWKKYFF